MATETDKILALQAGVQRRACVVRVWFTLFIASHFNSGLSRMKILSGETRPDRYTHCCPARIPFINIHDHE